MTIIEEYATTDIVLAAVLKMRNYRLDRIITQGNQGIFYFLDVHKDILVAFDRQEISVEPITYNSTIRQLTSAVRRQVQS